MTRENDIVGGRYRIIAQIGTGGMSTVYLAIDKTLNKQWAVKPTLSKPLTILLSRASLTLLTSMGAFM